MITALSASDQAYGMSSMLKLVAITCMTSAPTTVPSDRRAPAGERGAADDRRGDGVELDVEADLRRVARAEARRLEQAGDAGEQRRSIA